jgi:hypothetical protein
MAQMRTWLRFTLISMTVVGGLYGAAMTLLAFFRADAPGFGVSVLFGCILLGFVYVTAAGLLDWRKPRQVRPLIWALAIQIPWVSMPGLVYKFAAGFLWAITLYATQKSGKYSSGFNIRFKVGSTSELRFLQDAPLELGVNVAALALLVLLRKSTRLAANTVEAQSPITDAQAAVLQSQPDRTLPSRDNE